MPPPGRFTVSISGRSTWPAGMSEAKYPEAWLNETKDWLPEQLQTIKNLCDTALLLIAHNRRELLPTILEVLYEQAQIVVDEECVIGEG